MPPLDDAGRHLASLLQQYPQNPGGILPQIRQMADAGDRRARPMAGYLTAQQGQPAEAAPYIRTAVSEGAMYLAGWFAQMIAGQPDPAVRSMTAEFVALAAHSWPGFDPYSIAQQLAAQGDAQSMQDVLDMVYDMPPGPKELQDLVQTGRAQLSDLRSAVAHVTQERDATIDAFGPLLAAANRELEGLKSVAAEAGALASDTSAEIQAKEYGSRAEVSERRANRFTVASIVLAVLIASASVVIAIVSLNNSDKIVEGLQKAAFAVPFLFLNGYLIGLAREARREALRWRHVQLQLAATVPFLGVLDDERRKDVTALLALRFFPGQPLPDAVEDGGEGDTADAGALATLLSEGRKLTAPSSAPQTPT